MPYTQNYTCLKSSHFLANGFGDLLKIFFPLLNFCLPLAKERHAEMKLCSPFSSSIFQHFRVLMIVIQELKRTCLSFSILKGKSNNNNFQIFVDQDITLNDGISITVTPVDDKYFSIVTQKYLKSLRDCLAKAKDL